MAWNNLTRQPITHWIKEIPKKGIKTQSNSENLTICQMTPRAFPINIRSKSIHKSRKRKSKPTELDEGYTYQSKTHGIWDQRKDAKIHDGERQGIHQK